MLTKFTKLSSILLITIIGSLVAGEAKADDRVVKAVSLEQAFEEAYFDNTGDTYQNSSIFGQLNTILGFKGFPDQQISADGKLVDKLYQNSIREQSQTGFPLKTRDLTNPYSSSLIENPGYVGY